MSECGPGTCLFYYVQIAVPSFLFIFITTVIGITTLKYKNYTFTLKLLVALDVGAGCAVINYSLILSEVKRQVAGTLSSQPTKITYALFTAFFFFIAEASLYAVLWIFVVKYWSIATKIELAIKEIDVNSKNKLVTSLMICGLIVLGTIFGC